jgi:hypothetical protein
MSAEELRLRPESNKPLSAVAQGHFFVVVVVVAVVVFNIHHLLVTRHLCVINIIPISLTVIIPSIAYSISLSGTDLDDTYRHRTRPVHRP